MGPGNPVIAVLGGVLTALLVAVTVGSLLAAGRFATGGRAREDRRTPSDRRLEADQARETAETAREAARRRTTTPCSAR